MGTKINTIGGQETPSSMQVRYSQSCLRRKLGLTSSKHSTDSTQNVHRQHFTTPRNVRGKLGNNTKQSSLSALSPKPLLLPPGRYRKLYSRRQDGKYLRVFRAMWTHGSKEMRMLLATHRSPQTTIVPKRKRQSCGPTANSTVPPPHYSHKLFRIG